MDIKAFLNSGIIEKYVLGLASSDEIDHVERMTKDYPEVNTHICKMQNCMEEYAEMHAIRPPAHLKEKILASLNQAPPAQQANLVALRNWKWVAGIAASLLFVMALLNWNLYQKQTETSNRLALLDTQIKHLQKDQKALQTSNLQMAQKYSVLKDVTTRQIHLKGSQIAPQALAVVYWNPDHNKGYLNVVDMPQCPQGHQYQLWADVNGEHKDMGVLEIDANGAILNSIPYINGSRGFVITLEKEGGSKHPTVEKLFASGTF